MILSAETAILFASASALRRSASELATRIFASFSPDTAVALAAALNAERCDIYTDVDGVYTSDPRVIPEVKKLKSISYDEMLEMASMGAKVLHNRCVEIAKKYDIPLYVKSTFVENSEGTIVTNENIEDVEISGVTKDDYISRITVIGIKNEIGKTFKLFKVLSDNQIKWLL